MDEVIPSIDNTSNNHNIVVLLTCSLLALIVAEYGIDIHKMYPEWVIYGFQEPLVRFGLYSLIYLSACYNTFVAVLLGLAVTFLHIDYVNIATKKHLRILK
jgi:hypothetical protein